MRQRSSLSPFLVNIYTDYLSKLLSRCGTGCVVSNIVINHIMYADDLVIFSPCSAGLQHLLRFCLQYGSDFDIYYNAWKNNVLIVCGRDDCKLSFPEFCSVKVKSKLFKAYCTQCTLPTCGVAKEGVVCRNLLWHIIME